MKYADEGIGLNPKHEKFYELAASAFAKLGNPEGASSMRQRAFGVNSP